MVVRDRTPVTHVIPSPRHGDEPLQVGGEPPGAARRSRAATLVVVLLAVLVLLAYEWSGQAPVGVQQQAPAAVVPAPIPAEPIMRAVFR